MAKLTIDALGLTSFSLRTEVKGAYGDWGKMREREAWKGEATEAQVQCESSGGMQTEFEQEGEPSQEGYNRIP